MTEDSGTAVEGAEHAGAVLPRKPQRHVEDHAGEEPGLRRAEQDSHGVEAGRAPDERGRRRQHAPGDEDAGDPDPRAEADQQKVARQLAQDVAEEEDAGAEAEFRGGEAEILVHGERGEADIHAVEEGREIADHQDRQDAPSGLGDDVGSLVHIGFPRNGGHCRSVAPPWFSRRSIIRYWQSQSNRIF
jgi:hypothetical protein